MNNPSSDEQLRRELNSQRYSTIVADPLEMVELGA